MITNSPAATASQPRRWRSLIPAMLAAAAATVAATALPAQFATAPAAMARTSVTAQIATPKVGSVATLHFSWGCSANYSQTQISFKTNGMFVTTDGGSGKWVQINGHLFWQYTNVPNRTTYSGTIDGNAGSGASSTFTGNTGCWYLIDQGTSGSGPHVPPHGSARDSAGNVP